MSIDRLAAKLQARAAQSLLRTRRTMHGPAGPHQRVVQGDAPPRAMLAFCSNDYLGLASHPALIEALAEGARRYGAGAGASHLVSGHTEAHAALEADLATWMAPYIPEVGVLSLSTGYMANLAVLTALGGDDATIFSEALNHASLIDGARLARAHVVVTPHADLDALDAALAACTTPERIIATDAVFSMDGDIARIDALLDLARRHDAWLVIDDAHGFGVLGDRGHGVLAQVGVRDERIVVIGTLGKAAGLAGAFVAAHRVVIDTLVNFARTYIYTTAAPPAIAHALRTSLALIEGDEGDRRRRQLRANIAQWRETAPQAIAQTCWRLMPSSTAIQPLVVGDNAAALALAATLDAAGLYVPAIRPPTVPVGTARLRVALSAAHTADDIARLVDALAHAARTQAIEVRAPDAREPHAREPHPHRQVA